jgi:hypothetical protein
MATIVVFVEENENCPFPFQYFFNGLSEPKPVRQVRLYHEGAEDGAIYDVTGWTTKGEPVPAMGALVLEAGERAYLIYGGNGGLRLQRAGSSEPWSLETPGQWGESHFVISEAEDVVLA